MQLQKYLRYPIVLILLCQLIATLTWSEATLSINMPATGTYCANGSFGVVQDSFPNPLWRDHNVVVYSPKGGDRKAPVIFYSHAFAATDPDTTLNLFQNLASRGYIVVFSPYKTLRASTEERYKILWAGFSAAVQRFGDRMDLSRVGYIGWSFGGGATPEMAFEGITTKGWGRDRAFMFIMAPWYSYSITQHQLVHFPTHVNMIMQVYDEDSTNDHRMAIDIFHTIGIPDQQKNFVTLFSESHSGQTIVADHTVPSDKRVVPLAMRANAIYRLVDALADYTFNDNQDAKDIALGNGSPAQVAMGTWSDGVSLTPLSVSANPHPTHPESYYQFPWTNKINPRLNQQREERTEPLPSPEPRRRGRIRR